jgi:hypothetical protein
MEAEMLHDLLRGEPFGPFEVRMSNGDVHEVRHREFAFLLRSDLVIGNPETDRVAICSLMRVASVQTLQLA